MRVRGGPEPLAVTGQEWRHVSRNQLFWEQIKEKEVLEDASHLQRRKFWSTQHCTLLQTSIHKNQKPLVQKIVGISSKNGWEVVSCMISSNMDKNKRLLYILFPLSSLFPLPLPICSSKLDHPSPSSSSQWNSSVFLQFLSFFFHSSLYFYGLLLLMRYFATKKTNIFGIRQKIPIWWYFSFLTLFITLEVVAHRN